MFRVRILVGAAAILTGLTWGGAASAHIGLDGTGATQGAEVARLTFRVPNEAGAADTTRIELFMPADHPFALVTVRPEAGWRHALERSELTTPVRVDRGDPLTRVVSKVTWEGAIPPGEFGEFEVAVGPMPAVEQLTFKVIQSYRDGRVDRWIEDRREGNEEPTHPAPILQLAPAVAFGPAGTKAPDDQTSGAPAVRVAEAPVATAAAATAGETALPHTGPSRLLTIGAAFALMVGGAALLLDGYLREATA